MQDTYPAIIGPRPTSVCDISQVLQQLIQPSGSFTLESMGEEQEIPERHQLCSQHAEQL